MSVVEILQTWVPLTVGILSILTVVGGIIYKVHKKFQAFIKDEINHVVKEFRPNGGSSLKDQVNRLETGHNKIVTDVKEVKTEISELKKDNTRLEEKIDKLFDTLVDVLSKFTK